MLVIFDEGLNFGIDGQLQHSSGSLVNDFIERATVVELPAKGEYFGVELVVGWKVESVCSNLAHGVSLCPYRAAEVWLPQQDTPLFLNSSRTQVLTIPLADITGGRYYHADDNGQLLQVFREIALTLPVVLSQ